MLGAFCSLHHAPSMSNLLCSHWLSLTPHTIPCSWSSVPFTAQVIGSLDQQPSCTNFWTHRPSPSLPQPHTILSTNYKGTSASKFPWQIRQGNNSPQRAHNFVWAPFRIFEVFPPIYHYSFSYYY